MSSRAENIINGRFGVAFSLGLSRSLPPRLAHGVINRLAALIAARKNLSLVRAVRANQWVIGGGKLSPAELDRAVRHTFQNTGRFLYDFYHHLGQPEAMESLVTLGPAVEQLIARTRAGNQGTVVVGLHTGSFDLVAHVAARHGLQAQVIGLERPGGGYRWQNEMRSYDGLQVTPASVGALRQALQRLQDGGTVLTGLERPIPDARYRPLFFGRPAAVPVFHINLALKARVPIFLAAALRQPDGTYTMLTSDYIAMQPYPDRQAEIMRNAERILEVAESFIRQAPQQWGMYYPVWPEALAEVG